MSKRRLLSSILLSGMLWSSGCHDYCSSWLSCSIEDMMNTGSDSGGGDMAIPPGDTPYIRWIPRRIPIATPSIAVLAARLTGDDTVTMEQPGKPPVTLSYMKTSDTPDGAWVSVNLSWGSFAHGPASIVFSNKNGSSNKVNTTLVQPAFASPIGGTSPPASFTPRSISLGLFNNISNLFVHNPVGDIMWSIPYMGASFGAFNSQATQLKLATLPSPLKLVNNGASVFFAISNGTPAALSRYIVKGGANYQSAPLSFGAPWGMSPISALAGGQLVDGRYLLIIVDNVQVSYTCIYAPSSDSGTLCLKQTALPALPSALFVQPLDNMTTQVVALHAGTASVWSSDTNGKLTDRTTAAQMSNRKDLLALAVADMDKDGDADLVGLTASSVVVFLNNGSGVFSEVQTPIPGIASQTITLGDIDKDGYPDVLLLEKSLGQVITLLNVSDGTSWGNGRLAGPATTGAQPGVSSALTLDGQDAEGTARQLLWLNMGGAAFVAPNTTLP